MRWVVKGSGEVGKIDAASLVCVEYYPDSEQDATAILMLHKSIKLGHVIELIDPDMQDDSGVLVSKRLQWEAEKTVDAEIDYDYAYRVEWFKDRICAIVAVAILSVSAFWAGYKFGGL